MSLAIVITATVLATGNNPPSQREGGLARLNWAGTRTGCDGDPNTHRAHGAHLVATVTAQAITGTVTLKDGRSAPFTARLLPDPGRTYGLFRSEQTFHGVRYLGGWILNPPSFASARVGAGLDHSRSKQSGERGVAADTLLPGGSGGAGVDLPVVGVSRGHLTLTGARVTPVRERRPLTAEDREEISRGLAKGLEYKDIAASIERDESVVSREISRHGGPAGYRAWKAGAAARESRSRPKERKIDADPDLKERVTADLKKGWSPEEISGRLVYDRRRGETVLSVSHEAIYTWIYAQPKGELARQGVILRTGREQRKPRGRTKPSGAKIVGMVSIEDRPAEVEGRQVPGHWEGDLIIGKQGKSALGTLVERVSRFLIPVPLPRGHDAGEVKNGVFGAVSGLPGWMRRSLTWDQGSEMARHAALTVAADLPVYFAHAHSPWERGTNENTNGLIREYLPKGTEITSDPDYLWAVADSLNDRPRAILGFRKPSEVFAELLLQESEIPPA